MLLTILSIFFASLLTPFFYKRHQKAVALVLSVLVLGTIMYFSTYLLPVSHGKTFISTFSWLDALHVHLSFYIDGLSLFFALIIAVIGLLVLLYSFKYMEHYPKQGRFFSYLLLFMGSMLGVVLSANLISLFIFWELTSFSSYLLIGFNNQSDEARRAARQALLITAGGGLALLSGFILLELITDSGFDVIVIINSPEAVVNSELHIAAIILIALGAISKSAQFPLHFWLPNAMVAPTPVSAYLHSATMVKAGVYLIFRFNPLFNESMLWGHLLAATGAITMTWGAFKALHEDDLKRVLAYTSISALGIFFMMTGLGGKNAINAVVVYVMAHALYKGALFLIAGNIDRQAGTRNISQLSDLVKKMPYTAIAVVFSCASMAGIIPFLGFVGKESLFDALYHSDNQLAIFYLVLLLLASIAFTAVAIDIVYNAFLKRGILHGVEVREAGFLMVLSSLILAFAGLFAGIAPTSMVEPLLQWSASGIYATEPSMHLKLWHGFNVVLVLSIVTLLSGAGVYMIRQSIRKFRKPYWLTADFIYAKTLDGIETSSRHITRVVQNGFLRNYIAVVILTFSLLAIYALADGKLFIAPEIDTVFKGMQIYEVVIIILITLAVAFLFRTKSKLIVTATFGIIGYSIALAYTLFSAPDVAITQFLAETLTLILLILILHRLPSYTLEKFIDHKKYLPVAILFGLVMSVISFTMLNRDNDSDLKTFFLQESITAGKGENAVNVILVDFRALDTLGEITVLAIAMIGIMALLRLKPDRSEI
jgi:multicomponent Na+:H+ antiporter subunit A